MQCHLVEQTGILYAISMLKGLKTLYLYSSGVSFLGYPAGPAIFADLAGLLRLQHVAVQGIYFQKSSSLPSGCLLHQTSPIDVMQAILSDTAHLVTGLTLGPTYTPCDVVQQEDQKLDDRILTRLLERYHSAIPFMGNLRRLRLILRKDIFKERYKREEEHVIFFDAQDMPKLEVLEVDVHFNLAISVDERLSLQSLVVSTTGTLQYLIAPAQDYLESVAPRGMLTLKQMYLHSGEPLLLEYRATLEETLKAIRAKDPLAAVYSILDLITKEQNGWTARMPKHFHPSSLLECCCGTCPECLARAGVPIVCHQAWTHEGFQKHLRPPSGGEP